MLPLLAAMGATEMPGAPAAPRKRAPGGKSKDRRPPSVMAPADPEKNRRLIEADRAKREARRQRSTKNTPYSG